MFCDNVIFPGLESEELSTWKKWNKLLKELRKKYWANTVAKLRGKWNTPEQVAEILNK